MRSEYVKILTRISEVKVTFKSSMLLRDELQNESWKNNM